VRPSEEQLIRARYLQREDLAEMIHPDELSPATMRAALDRLLTRPSPRRSAADFGGTERAAEILSQLAGAPRGSQSWTASHLDGEPRVLAVWAKGATGPAPIGGERR
jgi:predicted glycosyltransferase